MFLVRRSRAEKSGAASTSCVWLGLPGMIPSCGEAPSMIFLTDLYYGHAAILGWYCGLRAPRPILAHLQHGWNPRTGFGDKDLLTGRAGLSQTLPKLVWSSNNVTNLHQQGFHRVHAVGSPFAYLLTLLDGDVWATSEDRADPASSATLAYPHHHHGTRLDQDLATSLRKREVGDVHVVLHSNDYDDLRLRQVYESAGFSVSCHGRRDDPLFLIRQLNALRNHSRVVTNRVSSAIWYAALLGCEVEVYGSVSDSWSQVRGAAWGTFQRQQWPFLFSSDLDQDAARVAASAELGVEHLRPAAELSRLLGWQRPSRLVGTAVNSLRALQRQCLPFALVRKQFRECPTHATHPDPKVGALPLGSSGTSSLSDRSTASHQLEKRLHQHR